MRSLDLALIVASLGAVARDLPAVPHRFSVGGDISGYAPLEVALAAQPATPPALRQ